MFRALSAWAAPRQLSFYPPPTVFHSAQNTDATTRGVIECGSRLCICLSRLLSNRILSKAIGVSKARSVSRAVRCRHAHPDCLKTQGQSNRRCGRKTSRSPSIRRAPSEIMGARGSTSRGAGGAISPAALGAAESTMCRSARGKASRGKKASSSTPR